MRLIISLLLFLPLPALGQGEILRYRITDNKVNLNNALHLIIRCETGIDSINLHLDPTEFIPEVTYYDDSGVVPDTSSGIIAHFYQLQPQRVGRFKLSDMDLWSRGQLHSLVFNDTIVVHPKNDTSFPFFSSEGSERNILAHRTRVTSEQPSVITEFDKETYTLIDTIRFYLISNRIELEVLDRIQIDGLQRVSGPFVSKSKTSRDGIVELTYMQMIEYIPQRSGKIQQDPISVLVDGMTIQTSGNSCIVQ